MFQKAKTISFIGGGNMAQCLVGGLVHKGYLPSQIWVSNPHHNAHTDYFKSLGVNTSVDNRVVAEQADILVFAVKPMVLPEVARSLSGIIQKKQICVLSIVTGAGLNSLQKWIGDKVAIVRAMPNTPALVGYGASGLYANSYLPEESKKLITWMMESVGLALWLDNETQLDTVTALSGSGPAYFFLMMEALTQAGITLGLSPDVAEQLTRQTALGAAQLACSTQDTPAQLRARVTSPGGTTEQAIKILEQGEVRALFEKAIIAAQQRAVAIAEQIDQL